VHRESGARFLQLTHLEPDGPARFAAAYVELLSELDWPLLGRVYCEPPEGDDFFGSADVEALGDAGLAFAADVLEAVAALPAAGPRASLYAGVGVAELAPALAERIVAGRTVRLLTLPGPEADELNRALAAVGARLGAELPRVETGQLDALAPAAFDHGWLVSVLNDPDAFPALHDELYGRLTPAEGATGRGDRGTERPRALALAAALLERLVRPAALSTTDEELPLIRGALRTLGGTLRVPEPARLSAIVGDPVRVGCRLEAVDPTSPPAGG
jgi:hypothetical protein